MNLIQEKSESLVFRMNIISIETASDWCGIAFIKDGICFFKVEKQIPREHAEKLPIFYNSLKDKTDLDKIDLDAIAISIGPGSFTGLRVGLGFAKGLAFAKDLPIVPVPTLQTIAANSELKGKFSVFLYSHRDIIYYQKFEDSEAVTEEKAVAWSNLDHSGVGVHYQCNRLMTGENYKSVLPSVEKVGQLAEEHYESWVVNKPYDLVPNYISPFELESKK